MKIAIVCSYDFSIAWSLKIFVKKMPKIIILKKDIVLMSIIKKKIFFYDFISKEDI